MKVYVLDTGWLECDKSAMVTMATAGTKSMSNTMNQWIKIPVMAILIDHPQGKILFDTGSNPKAMAGYWPNNLTEMFPFYKNEEQGLIEQLSLCNTKPEEIKTVILSHMHLDHAGNLDLFVHADVYVAKADFEYGLTCVHKTSDSERHGAYIKADLEVPVQEYHLVEEDFMLTDGVEIINLPGHTPGLLGVVVHLDQEGTLIFPQDAVYTKENYRPVPKGAGIMYDSLAYFKSIEKVKNLEKQYHAQVMFAHDMDFFQTIKHAPQYYE